MNDVEPRGAVHWIDHYVVGTNDMGAWVDWAVNATGITRRPIIGLTTAARKRNIKITSFLWWDGGSCRIGAFLQPEIYPPAKALGEDLPRCGFYIRPEDIDTHLRRLTVATEISLRNHTRPRKKVNIAPIIRPSRLVMTARIARCRKEEKPTPRRAGSHARRRRRKTQAQSNPICIRC